MSESRGERKYPRLERTGESRGGNQWCEREVSENEIPLKDRAVKAFGSGYLGSDSDKTKMAKEKQACLMAVFMEFLQNRKERNAKLVENALS